ncbi:MAG: tRNA (adenosine(37)-N6)-dimethylallyltransferase MiaA [Candidatus Cryosericum sp.]
MGRKKDYTEQQSDSLPLVIGIIGATGTGKSELSLKMALRYDGWIISADSMQVYRGMDIGTAKLRLEERQGIRHALIDIVSPRDHFSVASYQELALEAVRSALASGHLPIIVGGSGLYVRAVLDGYEFLPQKTDMELRTQLRALSENELRWRVKAIDPLAEATIAAHDCRRLTRVLEMACQSDVPPSSLKHRRHPVPWRVVRIGLRAERTDLYRRLDARVDAMIDAGMEEEVRRLLAEGLTAEDTAMQGIGYKELARWLQGSLTRAEAIELWKKRTRNYAKRQETWFRREQNVEWINVTNQSTEQVFARATTIVEQALQGDEL